MPPQAKILVSVATCNERENLPRLVEEIEHHLPQAQLLIVDDNSPDGTGQWCDERAATDSRLHCLHRAGKLGLGTATIAAMQYAAEHGYDFLINLDADFSHPPQRLPALWQRMEASEPSIVDVVIGSRYVPGGKIEGWSWKRKASSWAVNFISRWGLWLSPRDCSGAFRCYRVERLAQVDWSQVISRGYSFQEEVLWRLQRQGAQFAEVPITFVDRQQGSSKVNSREAVRSLYLLFRLTLHTWLRWPLPAA